MCLPDVFQQILNRLVVDHSQMRSYPLVGAIPSADGVYRYTGTDDRYELAEMMIEDWIEANHNALSARYPRDVVALDKTIYTIKHRAFAKTVSLPVLYKLIECLYYQCSEDVPADQEYKHERVRTEMKVAMAQVAHAMIEAMPEYKNANWGGA